MEQSCLVLGMAGTGKSKILLKMQNTSLNNEVSKSFVTACPTHKACKIVNGVTMHILFNVNPIDYSYGYKKVASLNNEGLQYVFIDEVSTISEQMWNVIAHIKQQFGFIFCGFGDFKQLKPISEEQTDFLNSWIVKHIFNNSLCESNQVHRFHGNRLLQDAYTCANGGNMDFDNYTKEEHDLCLCWTDQTVGALNKKLSVRYAKGKQIDVAGAKQSKFILHNRLKVMAYKSSTLFHNSEDYIVKSFNEATVTLINDTDNSEIVVELEFTNCFKPMYAIACHKAQGVTNNQPYSIYGYKRMNHDMLYVCLTRTSRQ